MQKSAEGEPNDSVPLPPKSSTPNLTTLSPNFFEIVFRYTASIISYFENTKVVANISEKHKVVYMAGDEILFPCRPVQTGPAS